MNRIWFAGAAASVVIVAAAASGLGFTNAATQSTSEPSVKDGSPNSEDGRIPDV